MRARAEQGSQMIEIAAIGRCQQDRPRGIIDPRTQQQFAVGKGLNELAGRLALKINDIDNRREASDEIIRISLTIAS